VKMVFRRDKASFSPYDRFEAFKGARVGVFFERFACAVLFFGLLALIETLALIFDPLRLPLLAETLVLEPLTLEFLVSTSLALILFACSLPAELLLLQFPPTLLFLQCTAMFGWPLNPRQARPWGGARSDRTRPPGVGGSPRPNSSRRT
jgi:hypothetical protein